MIFFCKIIWQVLQKHLPLHSQSRNDSADDSLAQQVEHNTFNVGVLGSSPKRITQTKKTMKTADSQSLSAVFLFIHTAN